jgi:hypothetical protein
LFVLNINSLTIKTSFLVKLNLNSFNAESLDKDIQYLFPLCSFEFNFVILCGIFLKHKGHKGMHEGSQRNTIMMSLNCQHFVSRSDIFSQGFTHESDINPEF